MSALVWYSLSLLGRGQSYLAPLLLFATALTVLTTNDSGALTATYAACAMAQLICMTWLTIATMNAEDTVQRLVTTVNAGGARRVLLAGVLAAALICAALTVAGTIYPVWAGHHTVTAPAVVVGVASQLACGAVGTAVGLLCSRRMIPRAGYALLLAVVLLGLIFLAPWLPPIGPLLTLLSADRPPSTMLAPVAALTALALALLAASFAAVAAHQRRAG